MGVITLHVQTHPSGWDTGKVDELGLRVLARRLRFTNVKFEC